MIELITIIAIISLLVGITILHFKELNKTNRSTSFKKSFAQ